MKNQVKKAQHQKPVTRHEIRKAAEKAIPEPVIPQQVDLSVNDQPFKQLPPPPQNKFAKKFVKYIFGTLLAIVCICLGIFGYFKWYHTGPYPSWVPMFIIGVFSKVGINHALPISTETINNAYIEQAQDIQNANNQVKEHMTNQLIVPEQPIATTGADPVALATMQQLNPTYQQTPYSGGKRRN
jgi:hypothetical protein